MMSSEPTGVLVVDDAGAVRFQAGVGATPQATALALDPIWRGDILHRRLGEAEIDGERYFVVGSRTADAALFLFATAENRDPVLEFVASVDFAYDILAKLVSSPFDGMTVVDAEGRIVFISPIHERFFGIRHGEAVGRPAQEVICNTRLPEVVRSGKAEIGAVQEIDGVTRVVSRIPVLREGKVVGAFGRVMFKGPDQLHRMSAEIAELRAKVEYYKREASALRNRTYGLDHIVGDSPAIRRLKADISKVAIMNVPVLLAGESGTGKELVAQAIHRLSPRRDKAMIVVNAGALPANLVESELFGYEVGAFTGAHHKGHRGKFEAAHNGTLFLDEIGEMPPDVQVKLLRVLQDGFFERVGGEKPRHSDFRLITATNRSLERMIDCGTFRLDLYYRISAVTLTLPPLRERLEDIPALLAAALEAVAQRNQRRIDRIRPDVHHYLQQQPWPGNVRQLLHELEKAVIFSEGPELTLDHFRPSESSPPRPAAPAARDAAPLQEAVERLEVSVIGAAMERHHGNKKRVAAELGISRSYLYKKLALLPGLGHGG